MGSNVLSALLSRGFFPDELPPVWSSKQLAKKAARLGKKGFGASSTRTSYEAYSFPHSRRGRRIAAIVNPVPFFRVCNVIAKHWSEIRKLVGTSKLSFSTPIFGGESRAIKASNFEGYRESLILRASGYSYCLHADFARFFPTIYTHAVEWATRGKKESKANLKLRAAKRVGHWGEELDNCIRAMQDGQTQGIPIGPDTSYIVAELVNCAIDKKFQDIS